MGADAGVGGGGDGRDGFRCRRGTEGRRRLDWGLVQGDHKDVVVPDLHRLAIDRVSVNVCASAARSPPVRYFNFCNQNVVQEDAGEASFRLYQQGVPLPDGEGRPYLLDEELLLVLHGDQHEARGRIAVKEVPIVALGRSPDDGRPAAIRPYVEPEHEPVVLPGRVPEPRVNDIGVRCGDMAQEAVAGVADDLGAARQVDGEAWPALEVLEERRRPWAAANGLGRRGRRRCARGQGYGRRCGCARRQGRRGIGQGYELLIPFRRQKHQIR